MSLRLKANASFLKLLYHADVKQKRAFLSSSTESQLKAVFEVVLNVLYGSVLLTSKQVKQLEVHKNIIRRLADRSLCIQKKRKLLFKHITLIPLVLKPVLSQLN